MYEGCEVKAKVILLLYISYYVQASHFEYVVVG